MVRKRHFMKRAERRHQKRLMKNWAKKVAHKIWNYDSSDSVTESFVKNADNLKMCSCDGCRNPRRSKWSKNKGKTIKEILADHDFNYDQCA